MYNNNIQNFGLIVDCIVNRVKSYFSGSTYLITAIDIFSDFGVIILIVLLIKNMSLSFEDILLLGIYIPGVSPPVGRDSRVT